MAAWNPAMADAPPPRLLDTGVTVTVANERTQLDRPTGRLRTSLEVEIANPGPAILEGPLHLVMDFTVTAGDRTKITVDGAQGGIGNAPYQSHYLDLSSLLPAGGIAASQKVTQVVNFSRPSTVRSTFAFRVFGVMNRPPLASLAEVAAAQAGQATAFDASGSSDPDGDALVYEWNFGDGTTGTGASLSHTYAVPGVYDVALKATDGGGLSGALTRSLIVTPSGDYALARSRTLDADGIPLGGVVADESGPAGATRVLTTDESDGYVVLGGLPGGFRWKFHKPGYLPVWRESTLQNGQLSLVASPWLTLLRVPDVEVGPLNAVTLGGAGDPAKVEFAAGSFPQRGLAGLTPLHAQGLPWPMPVGWSPLAAIHLAGDGILSQVGTASWQPASPIGAGEVAAVFRFEETETGPRWVVHALVAPNAAPGCVIDRFGVFVLALADTEGTAPPAPVVGEIPGAATVGGFAPVTAQGTVDPPVRQASLVAEHVRTTGKVVFTAASALPSGRMFRAQIGEIYQMRGGLVLRTPDYDTTFFAYQKPGDSDAKTLDARIPLRPSRLLDPGQLDEARVHVEVLEAADFAAAVVGPEGGVIAQGQVRISAPVGVLGSRTVVELREARVPGSLQLPTGWDAVQAFQLGFAGGADNRGLDVAVSGVAPGAVFVLARLSEIGGTQGLEPLLRMTSDASGVARADEPAAGPRLPGMTRGGTFVMVKVPARQGLIQGIARGLDSQPRAGLAALIEGTPWQSLTIDGGRFLLLAAAGAGNAAATDPNDGNRGQAAFDMTDIALGVEVTVTLVPTGPMVATVSPPAGAVDVRTVEPVSVRFSEALDPASFGPDGLTLSKTGEAVAVIGSLALSGAGTDATFLAANPLESGVEYTITLSAAIKDLQGLPIQGTREFRFTTRSAENRGAGGQLVIYEPDAQQVPQAVLDQLVGYQPALKQTMVVAHGNAGTADPGVAVILVNESTGMTSTVLSKPDGSFANFVRAGEEDFISAVFVNRNGTRVSVPASRQLFDDGRVGLYQQGGILEAESDGGPVQVLIEPDSIENRSKFKIDVVAMAELLVLIRNTPPENARLLGGVRLTVEGDPLKQPADLSFPANAETLGLNPGEDPQDSVYAACEKTEFDGDVLYAIADKMEYEDGRLVTHSPPFAGLAAGAVGQFLYLPVRMMAGTNLTVVGRAVAGPNTSASEAQVLAVEPPMRPVHGAVIHASSGVSRSSPRMAPGTIVARTNSLGFYALLYPYNPFDAEPVLVRAFSIQYPGNVPNRVFLPDTTEPGELPVHAANLIFGVPAGSGTGDTVAPTVSVRPATAILPVNDPDAAKATFIAQDDQSTPTFTSITFDLSQSSSLVSGSPLVADDVQLTLESALPHEQRVSQVAKLRVAKAALIAVKVVAVDANGNQRESLFRVRFGAPVPVIVPDPPSNQPGELIPPKVVSTLPGKDLILTGNSVKFLFSERIKRTPAEDSSSTTTIPAAAVTTRLSPDGCTLVAEFSKLKANTTYTMILSSANVIDLAGNPMTTSYLYTFRTPPETSLTLNGLSQASGSIVAGSYLVSIGRDDGGKLVVHRLGDSDSLSPAGVLALPRGPRVLVDLGRYSFRTGSSAPVQSRRLIAVAGGLISDPNLGGGNFVWIVDVSDGANPKRVASSVISLDTTQAVVAMRWDKPFLVIGLGGPEASSLVYINVQSLIVGSNSPAEIQYAYQRGTDLNADGDYVDAGEILPKPERNTLFGTENTLIMAPGRFLMDFDSTMGGRYTAALLNGTENKPPRLQVIMAAGSFIGEGSDGAGAVEFQAGSPRRVLLDPAFVVRDDTGAMEVPVAFVAIDRRVEVYDLRDPENPVPLKNAQNQPQVIQLDDQAGIISSLLRGEGNELVLIAGGATYLIDRMQLGDIRQNAPPPRAVRVFSDAGFVGRTSGASQLAFGISSGAARVVNRVPRISLIRVPNTPVVSIDTLASQSPADIAAFLGKSTAETFLMPAEFPLGGVSSSGGDPPDLKPLDPPDPLVHYYVRVRANGMLGDHLRISAESLDLGGYLNPPMGNDHPPVILTDNGTLLGLGGTVHPQMEAIRVVRLSNDPDSDLYNEYLSSPLLVVRKNLLPAQTAKVPAINGRKVLWSGQFLRFGLDVLASNADRDLRPYQASISDQVFFPGVSETCVGIPADYTDGPNPGSPNRPTPTIPPVDLGSGEFTAPETDYLLPGRHQDILLQRVYQSRSKYIGPFGRGWDHNLNARVYEVPSAMGEGNKLPLADLGDRRVDATPGDLIFTDGVGNVLLFKEISVAKGNMSVRPAYADDPGVREFVKPNGLTDIASCYESPPGMFTVFYKLNDGRFLAVSQTGHRMVFYPNGKLERIIGACEKSQLVFRYRDDGLLDEVEGDRGVSLRFGYYFPFNSVRRTGIADRPSSDPLKLAKIARVECSSSFTFALRVDYNYDSLGRLSKITPNIGTETVLTWDTTDPDLLTAVGERDGTEMPQVKVTYTDGLVSTSTVAGQTTTFDPSQAAATAKDRFNLGNSSQVSAQVNGNTTTFEVDRRGGITKFANREQASDDITGLPTVVSTPEQPVEMVYDTANPVYRFRGNLLTTKRGEPGAQLVSSTSYDGSAWNRPESSTDPCGVTTAMQYSGTTALLVSETTGGLVKREIKFNDHGQTEWEQTYNGGRLDFRTTQSIGSAPADDGLPVGSLFTTDSWMRRDSFGRVEYHGRHGGLSFQTTHNANGMPESQTPQIRVVPKITYGYDSMRRLGNETYEDNEGNSTTLTYGYDPDSPGKIASLIRAETGLPNMNTSYGYDQHGRLTKVTTGSEVTDLSYTGTLTTGLRGPGRSRQVVYGAGSQVDTLVDQGIQTNFTYLTDGRLKSMTTRGATTEFTYDNPANGSGISERVKSKSVTDGVGTLLNEDTYEYDAAGRISKVTSAVSGRTREFHYFADNTVKEVLINNVPVRDTTRDINGFTTRMKLGPVTIHHADFDPGCSQPQVETVDLGNNTTVTINRTYDAVGRLLTKAPPNGTYQFGYDDFGNLTSSTDPDGVRLERKYSPGGSLLRTIFPDGDEAMFGYDGHHRRSTILSDVGNMGFDYDGEGLVKTITYPDNSIARFGNRNAHFAPERVTRGDDVQSHSYQDGRLSGIAITATSDTLGFSYDGLGRRKQVLFNGESVEFGYHSGGAMEKETGWAGEWKQTLGNLDAVVGETYPSGLSIAYDPNTHGQARSAIQAGISSVTWVAPGLPKEIRRANGITEKRTYDAALRLIDVKWEAPAPDPGDPPVVAGGYHYNLSPGGRVLAEQRLHQDEWDVFTRNTPTEGMRIVTFGFGAENETGFNPEASLGTLQFTHGELLNPTTMSNPDLTGSDPRGYFPALVFNGNRVTQAAGTTVTYNADGSMSALPLWVVLPGQPGWTKVVATEALYDGLGLLRRITRDDGVVVAYRRDGLGRIVERTVTGNPTRCRPGATRYVWQAKRLLEEHEPTSGGDFGLIRRYCYLESDLVTVQAAATPGGSLTDYVPLITINGSIGGYLGPDGQIREIINYGAYGAPLIRGSDPGPGGMLSRSAIGGTLLFHGAWYDETTGLYQLGQRNLSPILGRFMQRDEQLFSESLAWFAAFNGDPAGRVDPAGMASEEAEGTNALQQKLNAWIDTAKGIRDPYNSAKEELAKEDDEKNQLAAFSSLTDSATKVLEVISSNSDGEIQARAGYAAKGISAAKKGAEIMQQIQDVGGTALVTGAIESLAGPGFIGSTLKALVRDGAAATEDELAGGSGKKKDDDKASERMDRLLSVGKGLQTGGKALREAFLKPDDPRGKKIDLSLSIFEKVTGTVEAGQKALKSMDAAGARFSMSWKSSVSISGTLLESGPRAALQAAWTLGYEGGQQLIMLVTDPAVSKAYEESVNQFKKDGGWSMVAAGLLSSVGMDKESLLIQRYNDLNVYGEVTGALQKAYEERNRRIERRDAYLNGLDAP